MKTDFLAGKNVLIMGLGRFGGGLDAAGFAVNAGAKVVVTDLATAGQLSDSLNKLKQFQQIEYRLGSHQRGDFEQADVVIVNPAVAPDNQFVKLARSLNKFVTAQVNIFFDLCPAPIIGITGANGKSTTAALTTHLLRSALAQRDFKYRRIWFSGNIGNEPLLGVANQITPDDLVVLELSSFQIEQLAQQAQAPHVALLTNLLPNHLDRYRAFENYCAAKENIFKFQQPDDASPAVSVFNAQDKIGAEWFDRYNSEAGRVCIKFSTDDVSERIRDAFALPGRANLENLAAAVTVAGYFGVKDDAIEGRLPEFRALPHRLELIAELSGVRWYNDSKATTPEAAIAAIEAFDQPVIIIAGGYDKHTPFDELGRKIARKAKAAILIGQTARKIAEVIEAAAQNKAQLEIVDSLEIAVKHAGQFATSGDVVLLSPACASYDMFDNYEHRGREFVELVRKISKRSQQTAASQAP